MPKEAVDRNLVELMKWALLAANTFFSLLHGAGLWLDRDTASAVVYYGYALGAP